MANFIIRKNQINNVGLTLRERSQFVEPFFLFVFSQKFATHEVLKFASVQNQASYNIRMDLVVFEDKLNPDTLVGEIDLDLGEWSYRVYESLNQTLDVSETTGRVIQKGLIIVTNGNI